MGQYNRETSFTKYLNENFDLLNLKNKNIFIAHLAKFACSTISFVHIANWLLYFNLYTGVYYTMHKKLVFEAGSGCHTRMYNLMGVLIMCFVQQKFYKTVFYSYKIMHYKSFIRCICVTLWKYEPIIQLMTPTFFPNISILWETTRKIIFECIRLSTKTFFEFTTSYTRTLYMNIVFAALYRTMKMKKLSSAWKQKPFYSFSNCICVKSICINVKYFSRVTFSRTLIRHYCENFHIYTYSVTTQQ